MTNDTRLETAGLESMLEGDFHCGYEFHEAGVYGHVPGQLATWEVRLPCGHVGHTCEGWKNLVQSADGLDCESCGREHDSESIVWLAI
jgi:hypothetical protein